jgi:pimeloyl-ACP methyl ester carboxylesterase
MYKIYPDGSFIEECRGKISGGAILVLDQPKDIDALRALCLECENLESLRDWIPKYDSWIEWFEAGAGPSDYPSRLNASNEQIVHPDNLSKLHQLGDALRIAKEVWEGAESDAANLRAVVAVTSGSTDINYEAELPALLLYEGSLLVEFVPHIPHVGFALRAGKFLVGIALKTGAVAPVKASQMVEDLRASVRIKSKNYPDLKRLDGLLPDEVEGLKGKKGVILLLHGLASTDVCTFDGFLDAWTEPERTFQKDRAFREAVDQDFSAIGWPHDTLTGIAQNARELLGYIDKKIGIDGPPVVFVCHSRGGLLARKVAVMMQQMGDKWANKVKLCVTFGTPHLGADLAANQYRFMGAYASVTPNDQKLLSIYRLLSYYASEKKFDGIDDLKPNSEFIGKLVDEERAAGGSVLRKLEILPVGGVYRGSKRHLMRLTTHMLGTTNHDLVVGKKSTLPDYFPPGEIVACSHFEYFSPTQVTQDQFRRVITAVRKALDLDAAVATRMMTLSTPMSPSKPLNVRKKAGSPK